MGIEYLEENIVDIHYALFQTSKQEIIEIL